MISSQGSSPCSSTSLWKTLYMTHLLSLLSETLRDDKWDQQKALLSLKAILKWDMRAQNPDSRV